PSGQGLTGGQSLPVRWDSQGTSILWRIRVPGRGNSSPVIWGDRIFLTAASADGRERSVYCFHKADGRLLWSRRAEHAAERGVRDKNGFASATPVTDGERVIVFLGSCGLLCYDMGGKLLWTYDDLRLNTTHGTASSPLLYRDMVLFVHDLNGADSVFLAL